MFCRCLSPNWYKAFCRKRKQGQAKTELTITVEAQWEAIQEHLRPLAEKNSSEKVDYYQYKRENIEEHLNTTFDREIRSVHRFARRFIVKDFLASILTRKNLFEAHIFSYFFNQEKPV